jgi:hypothetical protein
VRRESDKAWCAPVFERLPFDMVLRVTGEEDCHRYVCGGCVLQSEAFQPPIGCQKGHQDSCVTQRERERETGGRLRSDTAKKVVPKDETAATVSNQMHAGHGRQLGSVFSPRSGRTTALSGALLLAQIHPTSCFQSKTGSARGKRKHGREP